MGVIISLVLGAIAGWLGGQIFKGSGLGLIGNIIAGIVGGWLGYWILDKVNVNFGGGYLGYILTATIGAVLLLFTINWVFSKR